MTPSTPRGDRLERHRRLEVAEDRSKNIIVVLGPERPLSHRPYVDDVTDEVEKFAFHRTKESQQGRSAAAAESQVDVGKPDRAIDLRSRSRGIQHAATSMSRTTLGELQGKLRCLKTGPSTSLRYACPMPFGKGKVAVCIHDDAVASETGSVRCRFVTERTDGTRPNAVSGVFRSVDERLGVADQGELNVILTCYRYYKLLGAGTSAEPLRRAGPWRIERETQHPFAEPRCRVRLQKHRHKNRPRTDLRACRRATWRWRTSS